LPGLPLVASAKVTFGTRIVAGGAVFGPGRLARVLFFPIDHHPIPLPKAQTCNQPKQVPRKGTLNPAAKDANRGARAVRWKFKELIALLLKDTPEPALPHPNP